MCYLVMKWIQQYLLSVFSLFTLQTLASSSSSSFSSDSSVADIGIRHRHLHIIMVFPYLESVIGVQSTHHHVFFFARSVFFCLPSFFLCVVTCRFFGIFNFFFQERVKGFLLCSSILFERNVYSIFWLGQHQSSYHWLVIDFLFLFCRRFY